MADQTPIENLTFQQIKARLASEHELTDVQLNELKEFIQRIGGIENAIHAIEMLSEIEKAA